ncbi:MAG: hypothetical protein QM754_20785 [Tepidisphaeraceae bacterium]
MHDELGVPYLYVEWREGLAAIDTPLKQTAARGSGGRRYRSHKPSSGGTVCGTPQAVGMAKRFRSRSRLGEYAKPCHPPLRKTIQGYLLIISLYPSQKNDKRPADILFRVGQTNHIEV